MIKKILALTGAVFFLMAAACAFAATTPPVKTATAVAEVPQGEVSLKGQPLFSIGEGVLSFTPADRARAISGRIASLAKDTLLRLDSIAAIDNEATTDIVAGDKVIMTVTDSDARAEGISRQKLADKFVGKIRAAIANYNSEYSTDSLLLGGLYALVTTLVFILIIVFIKRFSPRFVARIESWRGTRIRSIRFQSIEIFREERIVGLLVGMVKWLRLLVVFGLCYIYIPLVFSFFPWTKGFSAKLFDYLLIPLEKLGHGVAVYLPNIFFLAVIFGFTHFVIRFTRFFFNEVEKQTITIPGFYPDWAMPTFKIGRFLIIAFAAVVAFPYLPGSDSPAFKGVSVFLGVLFSLGSTSAVANVVAGVILTYMRAFTLGDRVKIAETVGDVVEKTLLVTRIRTIKNVDITIPNAMVLGSHITNYSSSAQTDGLILHTTVTIGYDAPWRQVHELLTGAARATEHILESPAPFVLQTSLDDFYVSYQLNAYTNEPGGMAKTYSELHQNIQDTFNQAGVEIMSAHYSQVRDGNRVTTPDDYLPADYEPPAMRVYQVVNPAGKAMPKGQ